MPVINRFDCLKLEIYCITHEGWFKFHAKKEELIKEIEIPIADINQPPFTSDLVTLPLNLRESKSKIISLAYKEGDSRLDNASLDITISDWSAFFAQFVTPPSNYIEDYEIPENASMKEIKIVSKRIKRLQILYSEFIKTINHMFLWTYPKFSAACLVILSIMCLFMSS